MGITVHWLPNHGVRLSILSGRITRDALMEHVRSAPDSTAAGSRITYFDDDDLDLSELDLNVIVEVAALIRSRTPERGGNRRTPSIIVCSSRLNQSICSLWLSYARTVPDYPMDTTMVETLKQGCDRLGLDEAARRAIEAVLADRKQQAHAA